jgi:hypothetical protein
LPIGTVLALNISKTNWRYQMDKIWLDEVEVIEKPLRWHNLGLPKTRTGYGTKIETTKMVRFNNRNYRIYADCYSNVATCYILVKGKKVYVY